MKKLFGNLNPAQKRAVTYRGGPLLILAGAGSGKTRVLTHRAAWLVLEGKVRPNQLLLLTFTNKAAEEMKKRLFHLLSRAGINSRALSGLFAGTFHSFSAFVLRREGKKVNIKNNFVILDKGDQDSLLLAIIKKMGLDKKRFKVAAVRSVIEKAKNNLIEPAAFLATAAGFWQKRVGEIYFQYQRQLIKMGALDFDDLLYWAVKLFQEKREVLARYQERYRHLLIDEYQDTNHSQYLLTKFLAQRHRCLTVVGDAAQSIYSWRGADYHNLFYLQKDFPEIKVVNLNFNYRSGQKILDAAYQVIAKNRTHPVLKLIARNGPGEKIVVYRASSEIDEAEFVTQEVKNLVDFAGIDPTKIAVLYRTNAQSRVFEEVFIRAGLPYVLIGGVRFYDRAEVKDVLSLLRVAYNRSDLLSWQRIEKNMGKRRKEKIEKFFSEREAKVKELKKWASNRLLKTLLAVSGYLDKFNPEEEEGRRRLENIKELASVAKKFPDLGEFLENVALVQQEYSLQEKSKRDRLSQAVRLMTLHASKGLEFEAVFLVGMEEGLLPHGQNIDDEEKIEEERRLCYVGMTRAKKKLFLTYSCRRLYFGRNSFNEPSRFLADLAPELIETREGGGEDNDLDWERW